MKHIKTYKIFERMNMSEVVQYIKDILLELEDLGCVVIVNDGLSRSKRYFISVYISHRGLIPKETGDVLLHVDSFLKENGYVGFNEYSQDNGETQLSGSLNGRMDITITLNDFINNYGNFHRNPFHKISIIYIEK